VSDADEILRRCFQAAFPDVPPDELPRASTETVEEWDSLGALVLLALLEEAFEIRIPSRDYSALRSYASARDYVGAIVPAKK
jgi:acyl carrier protein